jgi:hypothetical protein
VGFSFDSEGVTGGQNDPPPPRRQELTSSYLPSSEDLSTLHAASHYRCRKAPVAWHRTNLRASDGRVFTHGDRTQ